MKKEFENFDKEKEAAYNAALKYLSALKTEKQVRDKLAQKGFGNEAILYVAEKCKKYGFINDEHYADSYVNSYQISKGKNKLRFELQVKGVKREFIENAIAKLGDETEAIERIAEKYAKNKEKNVKNMQKCVNHLLSKGFTLDYVFPIVRKIFAFDVWEDE